jgi:hypothetical protein
MTSADRKAQRPHTGMLVRAISGMSALRRG